MQTEHKAIFIYLSSWQRFKGIDDVYCCRKDKAQAFSAILDTDRNWYNLSNGYFGSTSKNLKNVVYFLSQYF